MSFSNWFYALGFNADFRDTGSSPPESGNWTISTNTACSGSRVRLSDGASLVVSGGDLTLTDGSLYLNGSIQFSSGKGLVLNESVADLTQSTYAYDGNGNLLFDGEFGYVYNDANQLYEVREGGASGTLVSRYYYNQDGRRIKKVEYDEGVTTNITYYVGRDFELQNYSGTTYNVTYYLTNGELVGRKDNDGSRFYYHNDHLGGTHVVTNSSGGVVERTRYYPFGKVLKGGDSKYTFTGQEDDKESNLMYYGARYYHPEIRRFTQPDPILQDPYNPQQLNRYTYVGNNPLKRTDPTGNFWWEAPAIAGYGYGSYKGLLDYAKECDANNIPFNEDEARSRSKREGAEYAATFVALEGAFKVLGKVAEVTGVSQKLSNVGKGVKSLLGFGDEATSVVKTLGKFSDNKAAKAFIKSGKSDMPSAVQKSLYKALGGSGNYNSFVFEKQGENYILTMTGVPEDGFRQVVVKIVDSSGVTKDLLHGTKNLAGEWIHGPHSKMGA